MKSPTTSRKNIYSISIDLHEKHRGKIETVSKVPITSLKDFSIWYTPGVAGPARAISSNRELSFSLTNRWNTIAVVTDGTRVLGLGDIGPEASLPVMEGKALLFKYLGGVDAVPLALNTKDPDEFISIIKVLEPSFGGFNLEDIASPKCFYILEKLRELLNVPVWHDDQQGTALVVLAALYNALKIVGKRIEDIRVAMIGAGAAGLSIVRYLIKAGVKPGNVVVVDINGILHPDREDLRSNDPLLKWHREIAQITNSDGRRGGIREAMIDADVVIAASAPKPGLIKKEWIKLMRDNPIVFSLANPEPEIWPWDAKEAGARIVATGRSDFPNQVNNSLGFPAVFRGALSVQARKITDDMCIAAAKALAKYAEEKGISEDYIIPKMNEEEAYVIEALTVAEKAIEEGIARIKKSRNELEQEIRLLISRPKKYMKTLIENELIT